MSGVYAVTVWRTIAKAIASFHNLQAMKEYLEMTLQLNQLCDIAATSLAITPYHTDINPAWPFRTFLAAIMHRLVLEGTKLGPFCDYDPAMNRLLLRFRDYENTTITLKHIVKAVIQLGQASKPIDNKT
uniref:Uncharacterized protein n=1 Tax=Anopheles maculatus TaxID=74869 RepID=A0A182SQ92_9DIPT